MGTASFPLPVGGVVAWAADDRARVQANGPDARALLHRLSTQHVGELAAGAGCLSAFLTDKGRLVDLVQHLDRGAAGVLLVGGRGRGAALLQWIDRYLFTEQVELMDLSSRGSCAEVAGARAPALVDGWVPGAAALGPWAFVEAGGRLVARGFDRVDARGAPVPGFLAIDLERPDALAALFVAGAARLDEAAAEALRIAAGVPGEVGELTEAMNPLDLALHDALHWAKGCYIGQEVVARLDTYGKQGRQLFGVVLDEAGHARVRVGDRLVQEGRELGALTSVSPLHNGALPSALAELKGALGAAQVKAADGAVDATLVARAAAQAPHG